MFVKDHDAAGQGAVPVMPSSCTQKSGKADSFEKRKALAKWIEAWTEEAIPFQSDLAFRKHLCDGSLLCKYV